MGKEEPREPQTGDQQDRPWETPAYKEWLEKDPRAEEQREAWLESMRKEYGDKSTEELSRIFNVVNSFVESVNSRARERGSQDPMDYVSPVIRDLIHQILEGRREKEEK